MNGFLETANIVFVSIVFIVMVLVTHVIIFGTAGWVAGAANSPKSRPGRREERLTVKFLGAAGGVALQVAALALSVGYVVGSLLLVEHPEYLPFYDPNIKIDNPQNFVAYCGSVCLVGPVLLGAMIGLPIRLALSRTTDETRLTSAFLRSLLQVSLLVVAVVVTVGGIAATGAYQSAFGAWALIVTIPIVAVVIAGVLHLLRPLSK